MSVSAIILNEVLNNVEAWNDSLAREHDVDAYYTTSSPLIRWIEQRRLACIRRLANAYPGRRLLEIGCGGGHVLRMFPQCELTGVDVSGEMLAKARRNLGDLPARLIKGEVHEAGLADATFDVIICTEVLEHVVDPQRLLREARRLLAPGGRLVVTFPNDRLIERIKRWIIAMRLARLPILGRISWGAERFHLHRWSVRQMRALLSEVFTIQQTRMVPSRCLPIRCCFAVAC
ncbi:MAG: class I SAM-dependent methyltransferase [Planctomycetota bacterium]